LGKGEVDLNDIERLDMDLRWIPGRCALCNGLGRISPKLLIAVKVDSAYLTTDLSAGERRRFLKGDSGAVFRSRLFDSEFENSVKQIEYLHFVADLDPEKIADFYLISEPKPEENLASRDELIEFINKVINKKKGK
jgi:hypothetical protein